MRQVAGVAREIGYRLRLGHVQQLPEDYRGERHVVITKHLPEQYGHEWVEFQEVPGPAPKEGPQADSKQAKYFTVRFIESRTASSDDEAVRDDSTPGIQGANP
jgi:hypothetical protein